MRKQRHVPHYSHVSWYRRRLPHWHVIGQAIFVTFRLQNSLPPGRAFSASTLSSGQAFAALDRLLDDVRAGPIHLREPGIARMVVEAICYGEHPLEHYLLHAFVVMPNHVHLLITPKVEVPKLIRSLKGITAKRANVMLRTTGKPFWQEESYDHLVRDGAEFQRIWRYIEENPLRAGLANKVEDFAWSSAAGRGLVSP